MLIVTDRKLKGYIVNKAELVSKIAKASGLKVVESEKALDAVLDSIVGAVKEGDEVRLLGFGSFVGVKRPATEGRNPRTGEKINIPEKIVPKFKPGKGFKDALEA